MEPVFSCWTGLIMNFAPKKLQVIGSPFDATPPFNVETHGEATLDLLGFPFVDIIVRLGVHFRIVIFPCHNVFWEVFS